MPSHHVACVVPCVGRSFAEQLEIAKADPKDPRVSSAAKSADLSPEQRRKMEAQLAAAAKQQEINDAFAAKKAAKLAEMKASR